MFRRSAAIGLSLALFALSGSLLNGAGVADSKKTPRPLRVLLFAGGPTREYQFLRALLAREAERKRAELTIHLQTSSKAKRTGVVQDVPPERLLASFPSRLESYDVVVAFDPDWTRLGADDFHALQKWVETKGGGLILIAGPIHTRQLSQRDNSDKLQSILALYPVVLDDIRETVVDTSKPRRLHFAGKAEKWPFLKLDEKAAAPLAGWEEFFTEGERGFFSYYPVRSVKDNAVVLATLADPKARLKNGREQPYLVAMSPGKGRVLYLGSGEIWRLRTYHSGYYERLWLKMLSLGEPRP